MKKIDAHLHFVENDEYFGKIAKLAGHENTASHLKETYDRLGFVGGIVMGNRGLEMERHQYPEYLRYCIGLDSHYLATHDVQESLDQVEKHLQRESCVGVKLYPGYTPIYVTDPIYDPVYELAAHYNKAVAIHTGETAGPNAVLKYTHPLTLDEVAVRHPKTQLVMCHVGNPWFNDAAAVLSKNPNVAADLSGFLEGESDIGRLLRSKGGYLDILKAWLGYVGYEKLMFGTDWPLANLQEYIDFVDFLVPERCREDVFYNNAVRIYGFPKD